MTNATHTPGPWDAFGEYIEAHDLDTPLSICTLADCGAATQANARLIAAAPDLLAALTYAAGKLSAFADAETDDQEAWILDDIERVVRAAIDKATGEETEA